MKTPPAAKEAFVEITKTPARIFAIGDLHGCASELEALLNYLCSKAQLSPQDQVIFIGDYIDRGPDSRATIEQVLAFSRQFPSTICLCGNHEKMFLDFINNSKAPRHFYLSNGGEECLRSYGLKSDSPKDKLRDKIPKNHLDFINSLERYVIFPEQVFAHAGLSPLKDLRDQADEDLFWIRDEFIYNIHVFNKLVVFGHTPHQELFIDLPYKLGIDTGLVYGNMLTCAELISKEAFQVKAGSKKVKNSKWTN